MTFRSWLPAILWTLMTIGSLPFVQQWRQSLLGLFSDKSFLLLTSLFLSCLTIALIAYLAKRIHNFKSWRIPSLLLGILCLASLLIQLDNPVEGIHVLQYGVLTCLIYSPLRKIYSGIASSLIAVMVAFAIGIMDEWIQHYLPARVGDLEDVWLNSASALGAIMIALALDSRNNFKTLIRPFEWECVLKTFSLCLVILAAFITGVTEKGYQHEVKNTGAFFSRFTLDEITQNENQLLENPRAQNSLRNLYPHKMHDPEIRSKADPFHLEFLTHLFRRDRYESEGKLWVAYKEHQILQGYYPNSLSVLKSEWSEEKESRLETAQARIKKKYISPVARNDVWVYGYVWLWAGTLILTGGVWLCAIGFGRRYSDKEAKVRKNHEYREQDLLTP